MDDRPWPAVSQLCYCADGTRHPLQTTMSTTTIRLQEDLKARVASVAERAGVTAHAFIIEAIAQKTTQAEARADFVREAHERLAEFDATGMAVPWGAARQYMLDRAAGKKVVRPKARKTPR